MSTTDVHRMIDSKLPSGKVCTGVTMIEVYTAIIDGAEISIDAPINAAGYPMTPEEVANLIVSQLGSTDNAAHEGGEAPEPKMMRAAQVEHPPPLDYDDGSDDDEDFVGDEPLFEEPQGPAHKAKPKKKAKAKRR